MTIYSSTTNNITVYSGLSTDVKPTSNVMPGSMFIETDTLQQFTYSKTAGWVSYYTKTGLLDGSGSPIGSSGGALYTAAFIWQPSSLSYIHASADASGNLNVTGGGGGGMVYPGAGIANSTGTAWGTSYTTTGSGTVVSLATSPTFVTPLLGTPTSGNLANCTGYTYANLAGTVPTWNQNTTGTAAGLSATLAITSGGTGQTTASAAFNALSPITTTGDLILGNGTNSATRLPIGASTYVLTSNGTTASWTAPSSFPGGSNTQVQYNNSGAFAGSSAITLTATTGTASGLRVSPRVQPLSSNSSTYALDTDSYDIVVITGQTATITSITTTGTPTNGQKLWLAITGTAAVGFTLNTSYFEASTVSLPTTTVSTNRLDIGFVWNVATSKWRCVAQA